jgi:hypothetical protein
MSQHKIAIRFQTLISRILKMSAKARMRSRGLYQLDHLRDETSSLLPDVTAIRRDPLVPPSTAIYGYVHDVRSGNSSKSPRATEVGAQRLGRLA